MRCPSCGSDNPDGAALCSVCDQPLTAYSGQLTGEVSETSAERAAHLDTRPAAVKVVAALCALAALLGPFAAALRSLGSREALREDQLNYIGAAFGVVGVALSLAVLLPLGAAMLVVAWGVWSQKSWAWPAAAGIVGLGIVSALVTVRGDVPQGLFRAAVFGVAAWLWMRPEVRDWYGWQARDA
jgi:hypothetical protein